MYQSAFSSQCFTVLFSCSFANRMWYQTHNFLPVWWVGKNISVTLTRVSLTRNEVKHSSMHLICLKVNFLCVCLWMNIRSSFWSICALKASCFFASLFCSASLEFSEVFNYRNNDSFICDIPAIFYQFDSCIFTYIFPCERLFKYSTVLWYSFMHMNYNVK